MYLKRQRYIPQNSTAIEHPLGVVYIYQIGAKPAAVAYAGKASRASWHNAYVGSKTEERRSKDIREFFSGLAAHAVLLAERKNERAQIHTLVVGDIIVNTWGYDQTNTDFYEVVKRSAYFVWLQPLSSTTNETGFMCGNASPVRGTAHGETTQHRVTGMSVNFKYGSGSKWDGRPARYSNYA